MSTNTLSELARNGWVFILYGTVAVLFGVFAIVFPVGALVSLAWAIGLMALIEGVAGVVQLFNKDYMVSKGWLVFYAAVSILFGLTAIINPVAMATVLLIFLAAWLIVSGIYRIVFAIQVRKLVQGEWMIILSGVLAILLGVLFVVQPLAGMIVTGIWVGVAALIYGILQIVIGVRMRKALQRGQA